jgi:hypothetical protein
LKGALLPLVGLGLLELMHADIATLFSRLIEALHLNADSRIIDALVKVNALQPHSVLVTGLVSLAMRGCFNASSRRTGAECVIVLYLLIQLKKTYRALTDARSLTCCVFKRLLMARTLLHITVLWQCKACEGVTPCLFRSSAARIKLSFRKKPDKQWV